MINQFRIILFFLFATLCANAQVLDSLEKKLEETLADSTRVRTLIALANEYQYSDIEKSIRLAEEAAQLAELKKLDILLAKANNAIGTFYSIKGNNIAATNYKMLALSVSLRIKDSLEMSLSYNNMGTDYLALGKLDEAYFYFTQSYRIADATSDSLQMSISLHNIGTVFKELGQYDRATNYLQLSKKISTIIEDYEGIPYYFDEMGDIYLRKSQYDSALVSLNESLRLIRNQKMKINELEPVVLSKIAKTYLHKEEYENANKS